MVLSAPRTALWVVPVGEFGGVARHVLDVCSAAAQGSMPGWRLVLLAPHAVHLHLVDAVGVDGEGVQVGDGEIDWPVLAEQCDRLAAGVSFIPEIWQGHVNNGEGFWLALERLERWF